MIRKNGRIPTGLPPRRRIAPWIIQVPRTIFEKLIWTFFNIFYENLCSGVWPFFVSVLSVPCVSEKPIQMLFFQLQVLLFFQYSYSILRKQQGT